MFNQRSLHLVLFHLLHFLCHDVAANTEIINFSSSPARPVDLPCVGNGSIHPSDNERRWTLEPAALHTPLHRVCEWERAGSDTAVAAAATTAATLASRSSQGPCPFSCPHELWLFLDLDDETWASYASFTLRLSWPASIPADFAITMYSPQNLLTWLSERPCYPATTTSRAESEGTPLRDPSFSSSSTTTTRSMYARIRAVDAGIPTPARDGSQPAPRGPGSGAAAAVARAVTALLTPPYLFPSQHRHPLPAAAEHRRSQTQSLSLALTPSSPPSPPPPPSAPRGAAHVDDHNNAHAHEQVSSSSKRVPFIVVLEPTYFGVLPASLVPTVCFLVGPVLLAAVLVVSPWVHAHLEPFVRQARVEGSLDSDSSSRSK